METGTVQCWQGSGRVVGHPPALGLVRPPAYRHNHEPGRPNDRERAIESLDRDTCLALLPTASIGRVGWVTAGGHAMILPVNFVLDGETIVFSTGEGDKLDAVREGRMLTFEVDAIEPALQVGWSLVVIGAAEVITSPAHIHRIEQLHLAPWVPLRNRVFISLHVGEITGRRLSLHPGTITVVRQNRDPDPGHE